jgi:hypothetical protein
VVNSGSSDCQSSVGGRQCCSASQRERLGLGIFMQRRLPEMTVASIKEYRRRIFYLAPEEQQARREIYAQRFAEACQHSADLGKRIDQTLGAESGSPDSRRGTAGGNQERPDHDRFTRSPRLPSYDSTPRRTVHSPSAFPPHPDPKTARS